MSITSENVRIKSNRRKTLSHADLENFLTDIVEDEFIKHPPTKARHSDAKSAAAAAQPETETLPALTVDDLIRSFVKVRMLTMLEGVFSSNGRVSVRPSALAKKRKLHDR